MAEETTTEVGTESEYPRFATLEEACMCYVALAKRIRELELVNGACTISRTEFEQLKADHNAFKLSLRTKKKPLSFRFQPGGTLLTFPEWYQNDSGYYHLGEGYSNDRNAGWKNSSDEPTSCPRVLLYIQDTVCVLKSFEIDPDWVFSAIFVPLELEETYDQEMTDKEAYDHFYADTAKFLERVQGERTDTESSDE